MMCRTLAFIVAFLLSLPFAAQEMVVFRDFRSLAVLSHRTQGDWTYLRMAEGELAVMSRQILEIRHEPASVQTGVVPAAQSQASPPTPANGVPMRGWRPEPPPPPQPEPENDYNEPPPEPEPEPEPLPPPTQKVE